MTRLTITTLDPDPAGPGHAIVMALAERLETDMRAESAAELCRDGLAGLTAALESDRDGSFVILYEPATAAVARQLSAGHAPQLALAAWQDLAAPAAALYRRYRRRIVFVPQHCAAAAPDRVAAALVAHFSGGDGAAPATPDDTAAPWTALETLLAVRTVAAVPECRWLDGELEAASLVSGALHEDVDAAFADLAGQHRQLEEERRRTADAVAEAARRIEAAQAEQHRQLEEERRRAADAVAEAARRIEAAQAEHQRALEVSEAERGLLLRQLSTLQEELREQFLLASEVREAHTTPRPGLAEDGDRGAGGIVASDRPTELRTLHETDLATGQERIAALERDLAAREAEIRDLRNSTSWKVTGPLRGFKRTVSGLAGRKH